MKKIILLTVALLSAIMLPAQGIFQLWGMTPYGGKDDLGVIFSMDDAGNNLKLRHQFTISNKGARPFSDLVEYNDKFYGMTVNGGSNDNGVIFEWDPSTNIYTKKYDFEEENGTGPWGSFCVKDSKLYGMTGGGGINHAGVIFEWDPITNIYTKKIDLSRETGSSPSGSLTLHDGKFYGVTDLGGSYDAGVIFEWDPLINVYTKKIDFGYYYYDGYNPRYGNLTFNKGKFYGLTTLGGDSDGGTIFEWDPVTNVLMTKINFGSGAIGGYFPDGSLILNAEKFYGIAQGGSKDQGIIFEWDPLTNVFTTKIDFDNEKELFPPTQMTLNAGKFYGMAYTGIIGQNVIFEWDPATNAYTKKIDLEYKNGSGGHGFTMKNGKFYGTASGGGNSAGVIFEWDPNSNVYVKKIDFNLNYGINPQGHLAVNNGKLYGSTFSGGSYNLGTIFEWDPVSDIYSKKIDFSYVNPVDFGTHPTGSLTWSEGKFYGMARGKDEMIFEWDPTSDTYSKKIDFYGLNDVYPNGNLTFWGGKFYGMTATAGVNTAGVIFEWDPVTNVFVKKFDFGGINGKTPLADLVLKDGNFYGMTSSGGVNDAGVIFEWNPASNLFSKKFDFDSIHGKSPSGNLALKDGKLYGMTSLGGINNAGIIFEWDPVAGTYTKKIDFNGSNGSNPAGSLALVNGKFYGMASGGGVYDKGIIFEWDPATNIYIKKKDFNGADGAGPASDLILAPAPVSKGLPGSCTTFPAVTIDNSNNNKWVSITDKDGNAVAEIKANGNNLGIVTASLFINNSQVREDAARKLYLDRNITLMPQVQPSTPVDIRLYIKNTEYLALKNAVNAIGQSPGIHSINNVGIYKGAEDCSASTASITNLLAGSAEDWGGDYVLSASATTLSSFYFAPKAACAAPIISEIHMSNDTIWPPFHGLRTIGINYRTSSNSAKCGVVTNWLTVASNEPETGTGNRDQSPDWVILDRNHVRLRAERDDHGNGRIYTITIHSQNTAGYTATKDVTVTVPLTMPAASARAYESDETGSDMLDCRVIPNPSSQSFNLQITSGSNEKIEVNISDMSGRQITKLNALKNKTLRFGENLQPGVYMIAIVQGEQRQVIKVIKQ
jgi:uncharacterized repeat protein (TIGR03803 family)